MSPADPRARALVAPAIEARKNGNHYNGFHVGAVGSDGAGHIYQGANFKPTKDAAPKCAEQFVFEAVEAAGATLEVLVIVGIPREEDATPTLHCCGERCRPRMRQLIREGKVLKPTTRIICVNAANSHVEEFTVESLMKAHGETLNN